MSSKKKPTPEQPQPGHLQIAGVPPEQAAARIVLAFLSAGVDVNGLPVEMEMSAFTEALNNEAYRREWEAKIGFPLPRNLMGWYDLLGRYDLSPADFANGRIRPRSVLAFIAGKTKDDPAKVAVTDSQETALRYIFEHRDTNLTAKDVADHVGVTRETLYKSGWSRVKVTLQAHRENRREKQRLTLPSGSKDADGNLEARAVKM